MSFKQTALWKAAFENVRADATSDEQTRLAGCYEAMRTRAGTLVAKIAGDLPHMTVHDVTHLDALWEMASIAAIENFDLNPAEAFVFGGAILLHDAAMTLAAFPGGIAELREQTEWRDLYARYTEPVSAGDTVAAKEAENRATADALRLLHAKQAENLPTISWLGPQKQPMFIIEDQQVRNFYGQKIGKVAYSHWWGIARVEEELSGTLGALPDVTNCTVDLLKVACLLRVADAMHLDQRRAPAFDFALVQPTGISAHHWKFQERMAKPFVQADALVYTAQPPFEADAADVWWTAFDALQMVDRELREGSISHEDDDDVTKREFESSFKANAKIAQTADGRYGRLRDTDWIASVTQGSGSTPLEMVESLLCDAWGHVESDEDILVVGEANTAEIYRTVAIYTPASE